MELAEARKQIARGARLAAKAREAGDKLLSVADRMEGLERALEAERAAHARTQADLDVARADLAKAQKQRGLCSGDAGRAIAERVKRLEAVVNAARTFTKSSMRSSPKNYDALVAVLAALDEKGGG